MRLREIGVIGSAMEIEMRLREIGFIRISYVDVEMMLREKPLRSNQGSKMYFPQYSFLTPKPHVEG